MRQGKPYRRGETRTRGAVRQAGRGQPFGACGPRPQGLCGDAGKERRTRGLMATGGRDAARKVLSQERIGFPETGGSAECRRRRAVGHMVDAILRLDRRGPPPAKKSEAANICFGAFSNRKSLSTFPENARPSSRLAVALGTDGPKTVGTCPPGRISTAKNPRVSMRKRTTSGSKPHRSRMIW